MKSHTLPFLPIFTKTVGFLDSFQITITNNPSLNPFSILRHVCLIIQASGCPHQESLRPAGRQCERQRWQCQVTLDYCVCRHQRLADRQTMNVRARCYKLIYDGHCSLVPHVSVLCYVSLIICMFRSLPNILISFDYFFSHRIFSSLHVSGERKFLLFSLLD